MSIKLEQFQVDKESIQINMSAKKDIYNNTND